MTAVLRGVPCLRKCFFVILERVWYQKMWPVCFHEEHCWKRFEVWKEKECLVKMSWLKNFFLWFLFLTNFFSYLHFSGALLGTANAAENCSFPEKFIFKESLSLSHTQQKSPGCWYKVSHQGQRQPATLCPLSLPPGCHPPPGIKGRFLKN